MPSSEVIKAINGKVEGAMCGIEVLWSYVVREHDECCHFLTLEFII